MTRKLSTPILFSLLGTLTLVPLSLSLSACNGPEGQSQSLAHHADQVAQIVARRVDRVSVDDLARWIIQGKKDFVLIDVRPANDFISGHIDGARNLTVPELVSVEQQKTLPKDRKVILYSQGSEVAAQAVVLLRLAGYDADLLLGGYNFWSQHVLNPAVHPTLADDEYPSVPEKQALACYFVGGKATAQTATMKPAESAPASAFIPPVSKPAVALPPASHEGC